jgi:hypothetical protein
MKPDLEDKGFVATLVNKTIISYEVKDGCGHGEGVAGSLKAITAVTESGEKLHLIFKSLPENPADWMISMGIFRTEHCMYRTFATLLREFANKHGMPDYKPAIPEYFSGFNNDKDDYLCIQDVRPLGFKMPDKTKSLTLKEMEIVLRELAKFHAVSYALIKYEGEQLFDHGDMKYVGSKDSESWSLTESIMQFYFEETTKLMESRRPELAKHMAPLVPNAGKIQGSTRLNQNYFQTIIHYDVWTNNLMIKYDESNGEPIAVNVIDFQFLKRGNIFSELQYLIFCSTNPEFRKKHLISVLSGYYEEFARTLKALNCPHPTGFSKGFLIDEIYKCYRSAYVHTVFAVALQLGDPDVKLFDGPDLAATVRGQYLGSPLALERLDAVTTELIELGVI